MEPTSRILVLGHKGMVGSALMRELTARGYENVVGADRAEANLTDYRETHRLFFDRRPAYVFVAAAKVGGIHANDTQPADFIRDNLEIQTNVISCAHALGTAKLVFLGSSCVYPKHAEQPMREECLLSGPLEPTNEPYAVAKIAGLVMCAAYNRQHGTNFIAAMPTNLYGPGDNFDPESSHVAAALIHKLHTAKVDNTWSIRLWGTGNPRRELMHVDDAAAALVYLMRSIDAWDLPPERPYLNVGVGLDHSIRELAETVANVVGYHGSIEFDASRPDGTPRKLLDVNRLRAWGWPGARIGLHEGFSSTYRWYLENVAQPAQKRL